MSTVRLKWALAGALRSAGKLALDVVGRVRPRPATTRRLPKPRRLRRSEKSLRLTRVVIACDLNRDYLDFWPLARRAWSEVVGLEPLLVLVSEQDDVPAELKADPNVHVFPPVPGIHTALQAQCIRLFYPAVLATDGGVVISDADMVPLSRRYFERPLAHVPAGHFVAYRNDHMEVGEIPMCYNAARPETWGEIFAVTTLDDARERLARLAAESEYTGVRGEAGWTTDQRLLYTSLLARAHVARDVWVLDDHYTRHRRLERSWLRGNPELPQAARERILRGTYTDFHCAVPYESFRDLNWTVVDLAIEAGRS